MLLEVDRLTSGYGDALALHNISLALDDGGSLALLGRNGAGKTTLMKAVMGLLPINSGDIRFAGQSTKKLKPDQIACLGVGYVPEDRRIFAELTVTENLLAGAKPGPNGETTWHTEDALALFPEIARRANAWAGTLSGGERQMLAIARALMGNPSLLLLDEPSEGLAPVVTQRLADALFELRSRGLAMLVSEQNINLAARLTDNVIILDQGETRFSGTFADIDRDPELAVRLLAV